jgi:hypothetical protein
VHVSAVVVDPPEQTQLDSTAQVALQPSPFLTFPSSQPSVLATSSPSPHIVTQVSAEVVEPPDQTHPASTTHVELHPSPPPVSPSSQPSVPASKPSPHTVTQFSFVASGSYPAAHNVQVSDVVVEPPLQTQPVSTVQVEEHPSLLSVSPSSQPSLTVSNPLPHTSMHVGRPAEVIFSHPN